MTAPSTESVVEQAALVVTFELPASATGKTTGSTTRKRRGNDGEALGRTPRDVLHLLRDQPELSAPQLAERLGKSERAIERALKKLREAGCVERVGPAKGGYWRVIE